MKLVKKIKGGELEEILVKAAKDVGLRTGKPHDKFETFYDALVKGIKSRYIGKDINLFGRVFPIAEIRFNKNEERERFMIATGTYSSIPSFGSKKTVERYLNAVLKYV